MTDLAALAFDWFTGGARAPEAPDPDARASFSHDFHAILALHVTGPEILVQRDYHAENLLWLPGRDGIARVGLLDFQDAMLGHPAYDLVSLLQDARRDVPEALETRMLRRYTDRVAADPDGFSAAYACLGAQRNLRILGVFARLCLRDGKPGYLRFIPRVWAYLDRDLAHPALARVKDLLTESLPPPTPETLSLLERSCATRPTP